MKIFALIMGIALTLFVAAAPQAAQAYTEDDCYHLGYCGQYVEPDYSSILETQSGLLVTFESRSEPAYDNCYYYDSGYYECY